MRSMRLVARALAAALVVCAGAEEMVEVFLASDRVIAAAATLNSVCDSATEPSGLRLHVVAPSMAEAAALEDATTHACGEASFVAWGLPELEAAIRQAFKSRRAELAQEADARKTFLAEELTDDDRAALDTMRVLKIYPSKGVDGKLKSDFVNRYYGKADEVV